MKNRRDLQLDLAGLKQTKKRETMRREHVKTILKNLTISVITIISLAIFTFICYKHIVPFNNLSTNIQKTEFRVK